MAVALCWIRLPVHAAGILPAPAPGPQLAHPDEACAECHRDIYNRYEQTSMAHASGRAADGFLAGSFYHAPSGIDYKVFERDGQVWLSYERAGESASSAGPLQGKVELRDYIGSNHRGRTYLFKQGDLWFEAPINYYAKKQLWDMAPNYSGARTLPLTMPVDSNCLHCHAGGVQTSIESVRNKYAGEPFESGGIGCAACHGDGTGHIKAERESHALGIIVNPRKLVPARRDSICLQCHLEGDAAIYKAGRSLAQFEAGDDLDDFVVYFVNANRPGFGDRASSQYEALLRSACKRAAGDSLTCTTCHDPHTSPPPEDRIAFYRSKCLNCHTGTTMARLHHPEQQDCAVCHMPTRDSKDISHEQLTDHDIERRSTGLREHRAAFEDIGGKSKATPDLEAVGDRTASARELGLAYAQFARAGDQRVGAKALGLLKNVEMGGKADAEVYTHLGFLYQVSGDTIAAVSEYRAALALDAGNPIAQANLAVLDAASGQIAQGVQLLRQLIMVDPSQTRAGVNLGFIYCRIGQLEKARQILEAIQPYNPDDPALRQYMRTGHYGGQSCSVTQSVN